MWAVGKQMFPMAWKVMRLLCFCDLQLRSGCMQCGQPDIAEVWPPSGVLHPSLVGALKLAVSMSDHRLGSGASMSII
jgi:hypothetical protein